LSWPPSDTPIGGWPAAHPIATADRKLTVAHVAGRPIGTAMLSYAEHGKFQAETQGHT
jgi:hypothetical protein